MKVSDIISNFLTHRGITTVFGIIGSANSHIFDSFNNYNIRIINVHNEQSAVIAAGAYFKTTGKLAVALVTAGAGATNAVTGIVSLWADSTPTIVISGQESSFYFTEHANRRMCGTQGFDFPHMVSKTTKYSKTILSSFDVQDELEKSFSIMLDGRKGPVLLDFPFDIQTHNVDYREWNNYVPKVINNGIANIKDLLSKSKRTVILAGNGIKLSNSVELFKDLVQKMQVPVLLTWSGIDILDNEHPLYFGRPGIYGQRAANFILQKSDLLIVLGSRLTLPQTGYDFKEFARTATIVMVDVDTTEFKSFAHVCINTDCREFINALYPLYPLYPLLKKVEQNDQREEQNDQREEQNDQREEQNDQRVDGTVEDSFAPLFLKVDKVDDWLDECRRISSLFPLIEPAHKDEDFPNSYRIIDKMSDFLKPDQIIVTDMGTALLSGHQVIRLKPGHTMFSSYGLGEMGYGLPAALGAALSSPAREVLCLNCDGGMMLNLQELQTIIQHKLKIKIVIFNNDGYLMIKHTQKLLFNGTYNSVDSNTGIVLPNYMRVADAFGYEKFQIKTWDDFYIFFPKFMDFDGPSICEIFMPPNQDFIPKVKGVVNNNNTIFAPPIEEMSPLLDYSTIQNIMTDNVSVKSTIITR